MADSEDKKSNAGLTRRDFLAGTTSTAALGALGLHGATGEAAQALTETLPAHLNQVFWANSGAEAIEGAIKLAKIATHRTAVIAMRGAFHGRTHAAMSVTSSRAKVRGHYEPLLASMYFAPYPYLLRNPYSGQAEDADLAYYHELEVLFDTMVMPDDVAAILVETIAGEGGYLVPTPRWMQMVRALCDKHGILLILDEIQTGMGRTGKMWGFEHFGIEPDIMTVAKGIASGLPVSAVVSSKEIMDHWAPGAHGGTYGGNAVGTAAAYETLQVMKDGQSLDVPLNAQSGLGLFDVSAADAGVYSLLGRNPLGQGSSARVSLDVIPSAPLQVWKQPS